jgi:hypothetical protein
MKIPQAESNSMQINDNKVRKKIISDLISKMSRFEW